LTSQSPLQAYAAVQPQRLIFPGHPSQRQRHSALLLSYQATAAVKKKKVSPLLTTTRCSHLKPYPGTALSEITFPVIATSTKEIHPTIKIHYPRKQPNGASQLAPPLSPGY
jgi:hypothetical protein